jgi:hypothetical protein
VRVRVGQNKRDLSGERWVNANLIACDNVREDVVQSVNYERLLSCKPRPKQRKEDDIKAVISRGEEEETGSEVKRNEFKIKRKMKLIRN